MIKINLIKDRSKRFTISDLTSQEREGLYQNMYLSKSVPSTDEFFGLTEDPTKSSRLTRLIYTYIP